MPDVRVGEIVLVCQAGFCVRTQFQCHHQKFHRLVVAAAACYLGPCVFFPFLVLVTGIVS